ncbi:MAG: methyltransferase small [Spirochaetes bacterium]|nr:MAG: methyltransferase small [Spirochaetota bacterium]
MYDLLPLVNKSVDFAYRGQRLSFDLSHALFSSFSIDAGTRLLLKEIAHDEGIINARSILDSGCGTGVLGISLAACSPQATVVLKDRDLLACAFSERNCWRNGIAARRFGHLGAELPPITKRYPKHKALPPRASPVLIAPGLMGLPDSFGPYEAVVSNLPAKAGPVVLRRFVDACAKELLVPGGTLAFVIVNSLAELADGWVGETPFVVSKRVQAKSHTVFMLRKPGESVAFEPSGQGASAGIPDLETYRRTLMPRQCGRHRIPIAGYWGLPEFDTNSFATDLAIQSLEKATAGALVRDFLCVEPGLGIACAWMAKISSPLRIHGQSRDYLALAATESNTKGKGIEFFPEAITETNHRDDASPQGLVDCILAFPDDIPEYDGTGPLWDLAQSRLKRGGSVVVVDTPTAISRLLKRKPGTFQRVSEKRAKGYCALTLRKV